MMKHLYDSKSPPVDYIFQERAGNPSATGESGAKNEETVIMETVLVQTMLSDKFSKHYCFSTFNKM